ncbi:MAG TPA: LytR C-terminal domain-containing protein [Gemmatimonadales bacterium]|jgi:hypothetical protein|nr:LytR C-terminal domain-containing protein [Gemmatimonadales bacterium]
MTRSRWVAAGVAGGVLVVVAGVIAWRFRPVRTQHAGPPAIVWSPLPRRVIIEVLNNGAMRGSTTIAVPLLRNAGLDVVNSGNAPPPRDGDRNRVLVRRGDTTGAGRVIAVLGDVEIVDQPDTNRLVDLSVLLGSRFRAPPGRP